MNVKWLYIACIASGLSLSACGAQDDTESGSEPASATGELAVSVETEGDNDVAGFKFVAKKVDCDTGHLISPEVKYWAKESLEEMYLPGETGSTFEDAPYRDGSKHRFSDHLFVVETGCYNLYARPITEDKKPSQDCAVSLRRNVKVQDADTVHEFHLVSQCRGEARTTLDIIGSLNNPPVADLEIQKFTCTGGGVRACVTASDPDGDPIDIAFYESSDTDLTTPIGMDPSTTTENGETTYCVTIPADYNGSTEYMAVVRDLGWDGHNEVPIEDLLTSELYGEQHGSFDEPFDPTQSRAVVKFPVHAIDQDHCIAGAMAFIGTTLGAKLDSNDPSLTSNMDWGMSDAQSALLAQNAIDYVNPNPIGDPDPRILLVLDDADTEDQLDAEYIEQQLGLNFSDVELMTEPTNGIEPDDVVGFKIVWLINPGYPIDDEATFDILKAFRENGGGVIVSGDDATQATDLDSNGGVTRDMIYFSFLDYLDDNGVDVDCDEGPTGVLTNNNAGRKYLVEFDSTSPLGAGIAPSFFPYGNDIDLALLADGDAMVNATTQALVGEPSCSFPSRDVMTTVPAGEIFDGIPSP